MTFTLVKQVLLLAIKLKINEDKEDHHLNQRQVRFSLIELCVVVAIMAVLIALLAPSLRSMHTHGERLACLQNVKSLAGGFSIYSGDYNDALIPAGWREPGSNIREPSWRGVLAGTAGIDAETFICPSRESDQIEFYYATKLRSNGTTEVRISMEPASFMPPYAENYSSYVANAKHGLAGEYTHSNPTRPRNLAPMDPRGQDYQGFRNFEIPSHAPLVKLHWDPNGKPCWYNTNYISQIHNPSQTILTAEGGKQSSTFYVPTNVNQAVDKAADERFSFAHVGNKQSIMFVDGHVEHLNLLDTFSDVNHWSTETDAEVSRNAFKIFMTAMEATYGR